MLKLARGIRQKRLRQQEFGVGTNRRQRSGIARRQELHRLDTKRVEDADELIFDHIGQRTDHQQRGLGAGRSRQFGHQRRQAGIFALGEGGFQAAAGIAQHANLRHEPLGQPQRGARQIELDHFRRARANQEQQLDVRPARNQLRDDTIKLVIGIGETGQILLFHNRGAKARLREDHHASRGLDEMRAGARAHHQKEGVLNLAMQPDNAGQTAKHFMLATLMTNHGRSTILRRWRRTPLKLHGHARPPASALARCSSSRAARSFSRNWPALMT